MRIARLRQLTRRASLEVSSLLDVLFFLGQPNGFDGAAVVATPESDVAWLTGSASMLPRLVADHEALEEVAFEEVAHLARGLAHRLRYEGHGAVVGDDEGSARPPSQPGRSITWPGRAVLAIERPQRRPQA